MADPKETGWETYGKNNHTKGPPVKEHRRKETVLRGTGFLDRKEMVRVGIPKDKTPRKRVR